jgi:uncharacterized lipoprotein
MIKIIYAVLLSAVLVISMSGCGSKEETKAEHPTSKESVKSDHPTSEKPAKAEHPTSEHPK